ncbi:MAG: V-type ATP synthase subunit F, partial [Thermoplasmata archaeon]
MKIFVIGDGTTVTGFRLAGVTHGFITEDHEEAKKKLLEIVNDRDI